jgi:hypothetical protein
VYIINFKTSGQFQKKSCHISQDTKISVIFQEKFLIFTKLFSSFFGDAIFPHVSHKCFTIFKVFIYISWLWERCQHKLQLLYIYCQKIVVKNETCHFKISRRFSFENIYVFSDKRKSRTFFLLLKLFEKMIFITYFYCNCWNCDLKTLIRSRCRSCGQKCLSLGKKRKMKLVIESMYLEHSLM